MQYVGSFILIRFEQAINLPTLIETTAENSYYRLYISTDGEGTYSWGKTIVHAFSFPVHYVQNNKIACFTGTISNTLNLIEFIKNNLNIDVEILRVPFHCKKELKSDNIYNYNVDPIIGPSFLLNDYLTQSRYFVSFMTNGVVQFSMTNNSAVVQTIIKLYTEVLDGCIT